MDADFLTDDAFGEDGFKILEKQNAPEFPGRFFCSK